MLINAFLLFGIDFRKYQFWEQLSMQEILILQEKVEKRIQQWQKYGNQIFPSNIQTIVNETMIVECKNRLKHKDTIVVEAYEAEKQVKEYLEDIFGDLNIKKYISTSDIVISCNELGISLELFDYYVSYKENRDRIIKYYPMVFD